MVTTTDIADNSRMRKLLGPAFTERAMMKQEPVIQSYVDLLIRKLEHAVSENDPEHRGTGAVVNIVNWYNFYTFDVIGDLGLGEAFGCLESTTYHPWVSLIFNFLKGKSLLLFLRYLSVCNGSWSPIMASFTDISRPLSGMTLAAATRYYPWLEFLLLKLIPPGIKKMQKDHYQVALDKIHRRMNLEKERDDFMTPVLKNNPNFERMSLEEIESTFSLLIVAGSETTATVLSGITNELVKAPTELRKLVQEIRSTFKSKDEITFAALRDLPFLNAVIHEGLRLCNPVPAGLPRLVPKGGDTVCGHFLPEYVRRPSP